MKILNLYAGIGGNRKHWGDNHQITAVEFDERIADIYRAHFPQDIVICTDAHQYLLDHYAEFDFIWSSSPCPTHSILSHLIHTHGIVRYPDMQLYEEILLLKHFYKGIYCVENVKSYYDPLIPPQVSGRHYFWANFRIPKLSARIPIRATSGRQRKFKKDEPPIDEFDLLGFDLSGFKHPDKRKLLRNCVDPLIGKAIFERVERIHEAKSRKQLRLFDDE